MISVRWKGAHFIKFSIGLFDWLVLYIHTYIIIIHTSYILHTHSRSLPLSPSLPFPFLFILDIWPLSDTRYLMFSCLPQCWDTFVLSVLSILIGWLWNCVFLFCCYILGLDVKNECQLLWVFALVPFGASYFYKVWSFDALWVNLWIYLEILRCAALFFYNVAITKERHLFLIEGPWKVFWSWVMWTLVFVYKHWVLTLYARITLTTVACRKYWYLEA